MNIKRINECLYIKVLSESEIRLYEYIKKELSQINPNDRLTMEKVIHEVLSRVKQDITNMNGEFGVISVNGKNGLVTITPQNIGAEPSFNKRSAFNKEFGTTFNTVCEGDDPRLSDSRTPLEHKHEAIEIEGLDKMIGFNDKIIKLEEKAHTHNNKQVLDRVTYTGDNDTVDLIKLERLDHYIDIDIDAIVNHTSRDEIHVTQSDKDNWSAKETQAGSQQKADDVLRQAKSYADGIQADLLGNASSDYQSLGKIETKMRELGEASSSTDGELIAHVQNRTVHMTAEERSLIGTITEKAEKTHQHKAYLQCRAFVSIAEMP